MVIGGVGEPGQWMPIARVERCRRPCDGVTDPRLNMRIVIDIKVVIYIDETIPSCRPKCNECHEAEQ